MATRGTKRRRAASEEKEHIAGEPAEKRMCKKLGGQVYKFGDELEQDVLRSMMEAEAEQSLLSTRADYFKHRRILVDWMAGVTVDFDVSNLSLHLAVAYLDRIYTDYVFKPARMQLVALSCMIIAVKYHEKEKSLWLDEVAARYKLPVGHVLQMETHALHCLDWRLGTVTPLHFLEAFLEHAIDVENDTADFRAISEDNLSRVNGRMSKFSNFFIEMCLQEHYFSQCGHPSLVAASAVAVARKVVNIRPKWSPRLEALTSYTLDDVEPVANEILRIYNKTYGFNNKLSPPEATSAQSVFKSS